MLWLQCFIVKGTLVWFFRIRILTFPHEQVLTPPIVFIGDKIWSFVLVRGSVKKIKMIWKHIVRSGKKKGDSVAGEEWLQHQDELVQQLWTTPVITVINVSSEHDA
jgi:hypothetical protein